MFSETRVTNIIEKLNKLILISFSVKTQDNDKFNSFTIVKNITTEHVRANCAHREKLTLRKHDIAGQSVRRTHLTLIKTSKKCSSENELEQENQNSDMNIAL